MIVVGLTGGLATGKSTVARLFHDCGAIVLDADLIARQVVEPGKPAWRDIVREFGPEVLHHDRTINRAALAALVFRNRTKLRRLNALVHPRVAREQGRFTRDIARKMPDAVLIYNAPLLIEAKAHKRMQRIIVVSADEDTQVTRLHRRDGFIRSEAIRRIRTQMPLRKKIELSDYVIDGTLPRRQLRGAVRRIYGELRHAVVTEKSGRRIGERKVSSCRKV